MSAGGSSGSQVAHPAETVTVVDATRTLIATLRTADAPADVLERAAALVREAAELLSAHQVEGVPGQNALRVCEAGPEAFATGDPARFFPYSPVVGPLSPIAPPLVVHLRRRAPPRSRHAVGGLRRPARHGARRGGGDGARRAARRGQRVPRPRRVHGNAERSATNGPPRSRPSSRFESWVDRTEGRKVFTVGTISRGGEVTARAEGVFIRVADRPSMGADDRSRDHLGRAPAGHVRTGAVVLTALRRRRARRRAPAAAHTPARPSSPCSPVRPPRTRTRRRSGTRSAASRPATTSSRSDARKTSPRWRCSTPDRCGWSSSTTSTCSRTSGPRPRRRPRDRRGHRRRAPDRGRSSRWDSRTPITSRPTTPACCSRRAAAGPRVVLLRGQRLQAHPGHARVAHRRSCSAPTSGPRR